MIAVKEKFSDAIFFLFYVSLFVLQTLPGFALAFVAFNNAWFWIMCAIGLVAMITQAIKFPCFNTRIWNSAMIALAIISYLMRGWV